MLITLCYVYLWVRFQKCYTAVIRSALRRLSASRSGVAFCALREHSSPSAAFLARGNKAIYITEPQVNPTPARVRSGHRGYVHTSSTSPVRTTFAVTLG